jgi:hypothetical protein
VGLGYTAEPIRIGCAMHGEDNRNQHGQNMGTTSDATSGQAVG